MKLRFEYIFYENMIAHNAYQFSSRAFEEIHFELELFRVLRIFTVK